MTHGGQSAASAYRDSGQALRAVCGPRKSDICAVAAGALSDQALVIWQAPGSWGRRLMDILAALDDRNLLGASIRDAESWKPWRALLAASFGGVHGGWCV